jgi:hypothetical protein
MRNERLINNLIMKENKMIHNHVELTGESRQVRRGKQRELNKSGKKPKWLDRLDNEDIGKIYIDNPVIDAIDKPDFINQRNIINVITGQMALGKSFRTQTKIIPHLFYNYDVPITILTAPNLEVLDYNLAIETWERRNKDKNNKTKVIVIDKGTSPADDINNAVTFLKQGFKVLLLCSNQSFWSDSPSMRALKKVISNKKLTPALFVDEADKHTISCWENYKNGKGWNAYSRKDYGARMFNAVMEFANISPFIFMLTATPHAEMRGELPTSNGVFRILNSPAPLDVIVPVMGAIRGITKFKAMFKGTQDNKINTYKYFLEKATIAHLNRPGKKKTMIVKCKPANGNHGLSIHETRKIISAILISRGYDDTEHKIAVMTSDNKKYYGPYGQFQQTYGDESECFSRLNDFEDSLEFLLVVNKGQSGINVANLKTVFYITDKKSRDEDGNPVVEAIIQFLGRGSRFNPGIPLKEWNEINGRGISKDWTANATRQEKLDLMEENVLDVWVPEMDVWSKGLSEFIENYIPSINHLEKLLFPK